MNKQYNWGKILAHLASYVLVAVVASAVTLVLFCTPKSKLDQLQELIQTRFIGEVDVTALEDAAASAMVDAIEDRWSYYISAEDYASHADKKTNSYVGIGITIGTREDKIGFDILQVSPDGSAQEGGILPGDILIEAEGQSVAELGTSGTSTLIKGKEGTKVSVAVLRNGERLEFSLTRKRIQTIVAEGKMLDGNIGLVTIANFNDKCAAETIAAVEELVEQGAEALIFDVRNNPGGYKDELVEILNYLLPEGPLFRSVLYTGEEEVDQSDAACLEIPMAVMVNGNSYSAAEFFAAALEEYDWAIVVGEQTCGKGYFQYTMRLSDGSAVNLSVGKYTTPNNVNLTEVGGLTPEVYVEVDTETAALIASGLLDAQEDPQIQAAVQALKK